MSQQPGAEVPVSDAIEDSDTDDSIRSITETHDWINANTNTHRPLAVDTKLGAQFDENHLSKASFTGPGPIPSNIGPEGTISRSSTIASACSRRSIFGRKGKQSSWLGEPEDECDSRGSDKSSHVRKRLAKKWSWLGGSGSSTDMGKDEKASDGHRSGWSRGGSNRLGLQDETKHNEWELEMEHAAEQVSKANAKRDEYLKSDF